MMNPLRIFRTERRDAYDAGHYCHNLQTVARHQMAEAARLIRINRLQQFSAVNTAARADAAKRHMREALAARSEAAMILRAMRERDGFMTGWRAAA